MIINEEPSPVKRLIAEALKVSNSLLQKVSRNEMGEVKRGVNGLVLFSFVGINFFLMNGLFIENQIVSAKENEKVEIKNVSEKIEIGEEMIDFDEIMGQDPDKIIEDLVEKVEKEKHQQMVVKELAIMLEDHPMAEMADLIAQQDDVVAALIIGIGKKESNWGKRSPSKDGQDCFNYWGYKTSGSRGQALGHACFGSREEAVEKIANRISYFVHETDRDTPAKMVVWKCGSSCATTGGQAAADKWIRDVQIYYDQFLAFDVVDDSQKNVKLAKLGEF